MNILLLGMPGSGKTKIGKLLARRLKRGFVDVDEFIKQETGKDSAQHLQKLGDREFLKFEAALVQKIQATDSVIATSGSTPLVKAGIKHLKKNAFAIWIKPPLQILKKRVKKRSDGTSRIVGMQSKTLAEIWEWRKKAYAEHSQAILKIEAESSKAEVVDQLIRILDKNVII